MLTPRKAFLPHWMENAFKKACEARIESISKLGHAAHVHLILATQAPNRQTLKANITLNITARVALHCDSPIESRQIIGCNGAETLPRYGQCYYKTPEGLERWELPMIPAEDIADRIKWWTEQTKPKLFRFSRNKSLEIEKGTAAKRVRDCSRPCFISYICFWSGTIASVFPSGASIFRIVSI